jgi:phage terminase small subunit
MEEMSAKQDMLMNPDQYSRKVLRSKRMRLSQKQEKFVEFFVYHDLTNTECARRAGYQFPSEVATRMLNDPRFTHVQEKIRELKEVQQRKHEITFEKVARDLQAIRDAALEDGAYGPAVQAEMGRAKLAGLLIERKEIKHGKIDQMDRHEVEARLRALLEKNDLGGVIPNQQVKDVSTAHEGSEGLIEHQQEDDGEYVVDFEEVEVEYEEVEVEDVPSDLEDEVEEDDEDESDED